MGNQRNVIVMVVMIVIIICSSLSTSRADNGNQWFDCSPANGASYMYFKSFTLFPNPVQVHQTVHLRAVVDIPTKVTSGTVTLQMWLNYPNNWISIPGIDLCSLSSVQCPLSSGLHPISFDFNVPQVPVGTYTLMYSIVSEFSVSKGCLAFEVTVTDSQQGNTYTSWFSASLLGTAQFDQPDYSKRTLQGLVQVGKFGSISSSSSKLPWGTFDSLVGSEDLVPPFFNTNGYVWGLSGNMTGLKTVPASDGTTTYIQTYEGNVYVGYQDSTTTFNNSDDSILTGDFELTWTYTSKQTYLDGQIYIADNATLPTGWPSPLTYGRFPVLSVKAGPSGSLQVNASMVYCAGGTCASTVELGTSSESGITGLTAADYTLIFVLIFGVAILLVGAVLFQRYLKRQRRKKEEDSIFSGRKANYGSPLVVDDIIQETKDHKGSLLPRLERHRDDDLSSDYSSEEERQENLSEERRSISRSRSRSRSRSSRSRSRSRSRSESYSRSASDSRSESRSRSSSRERPSRRRKSKRSRSLDSRDKFESRSYDKADDSSASRITDEDSDDDVRRPGK